MVFEVVSEYDTAARVDVKVATYLANGAAEVWVIYPGDHGMLGSTGGLCPRRLGRRRLSTAICSLA